MFAFLANSFSLFTFRFTLFAFIMFTHHTTRGIILRKKKLREADEIITLFTRDFGKTEVIGRSIRKGNSKLKMNTSLFSLVEASFVEGRAGNTLTDAAVIADFREAKKDLGKLSLFYRIAEEVFLLCPREEKEKDVFLLLLESFLKIEKEKLTKKELKVFFCLFSFRFLYFLGYKLYIEKCAFCGESVRGECHFNPEEGGVVCRSCFSLKPPSRINIYLEDVNLLRSFLKPGEKKDFVQDPGLFMDILKSYLAFVPEGESFLDKGLNKNN